MSKLNFLNTIKVVAEEQPKTSTSTKRKEWGPTSGLRIRLWKDGSIYPSAELVDAFDLEYRRSIPDDEAKKITDEGGTLPFPGNGFDVVDTKDFPTFQSPQRLLVICPIRKDEGKVSLFYTVGYNADLTPKVSVKEQGLATFGVDFMIPAIEEIYGVKMGRAAVPEKKDTYGNVITEGKPAIDGLEYVDLVLVNSVGEESKENPWTLPSDKQIAYLPKRVSRGEEKGKTTIIRRENPQMYALVPASMVDESSTDDNAGKAQDSEKSHEDLEA